MRGTWNQRRAFARVLAMRTAIAGLLVAGITTLPVGSTNTQVLASSAPIVQQVSSDPYTNSTGQHQTQVEPDVASSGNTIVAALQSGRMTSSVLGSTNIGWATSTDGGATWAHGFLPSLTVYSTPAGTYYGATDPTVT